MKVKFLTILILLTFTSCLNIDQNQNVNNSSSSNITVENRLANKDYSNKSVNLNEPQARAKFDKQIEELNKNRELWKAQNIPNYDFVCERFAGGMSYWSPAKIKVRNNKAVTIEANEKSNYIKLDGYEAFDKIEKLFDLIQFYLEDGATVECKYNIELGYPERFSASNWRAIDAISGFEVKKLEKVN